jgi:hypothetical protein
MIRRKLGLLGLCAVVFGVMAFAASAAQAEAGANWLILTSGGALKNGGELHATVSAELESTTASLLSEVLEIKVQILCTGVTLIGASLEGNGSVTNGGKAKFEGCTVDLNGAPAPECEVHSSLQPVETVETNAAKGLLVLISGAAVTLLEPKEGETFVNINMGEECPIGENIPVRGKLALKDTELTKHLVKHLVTESTTGTDLWVLNKTLEHKATIDGSAKTFLTGAHATLLWGGDPA